MKSFLPDKLYDILSWLALVALDALGELYKILANVWHLPYGEQVFQTCVAVSVCLGILIGVSKAQYHKNVNADIKQIEDDLFDDDDVWEGDDEDDDIEEMD